MKRRMKVLGGLAIVATSALVIAGCSSSSSPDATDSATAGDPSAIILVNGTEPQNPLIPTNTNEVGGGKILDSIFAGLVTYAADGSPVNDVAEEIVVEDAQNLTVTIKEGLSFTNGEAVTSQSFIDAWNYGALASNDQLSSYFFQDIVGFSYEEDSELTGLVAVDDHTFTIELNKPASDFALRLGYSAYFPLPSVAYDDMAAFGENPIGNGPYMLDGDGAWQHDVQIDLVTNPDYEGPRTPANGGLTFVFYAQQEAAYADLQSDEVDVVDAIPAVALPTFEADLGDRAINQPSAVFHSFTIPESLEHFSGEEGDLRRQAISLSFDRDQITQVVFNGTRTPANDFTSPVIPGWSDDIEGSDVLDYDPEQAAELWAQANAISPWTGSFHIAYNTDGGHSTWVDAVTNSIADTLDIDASGAPIPTFADLRTQVTDRTITTAFRTGWQADYPGMYNFLGPLYATGAGSNDGDYSNAEFDSLIAQGIGEVDLDAAVGYYGQAQTVLFTDLPAVPLWYANVTGGYSQNVENVVFGWNSVPLYYQITKG